MNLIKEFFFIFQETHYGHYISELETAIFLAYFIGIVALPISLLFAPWVAVLITTIASIGLYLLALYLISYGNSDFLIFHPVLLILILLCGFFIFININAAKLLSTYFSDKLITGKEFFFIFLFLFYSLPIIYGLINFFQMAMPAISYDNLEFNITHDIKNPVLVENVIFKNSKNNKQIEYKQFQNSSTNRDNITPELYENLSSRDKYYNRILKIKKNKDLTKNSTSNGKNTYIPRGTDLIKITWYSPLERKKYSDEFPIPIDNLEFYQDFNLGVKARTKTIRDLTFNIFTNGKASLFHHYHITKKGLNGGSLNLANYIKIIEKKAAPTDLDKLNNFILKKDWITQLENETKFYDWELGIINKNSLKKIEDIIKFEFTSGLNNNLYANTFKHIRSPLPIALAFVYKKKEYLVYFDTEKLFKIITENVLSKPNSHGKSEIQILIEFDKSNYKNIGSKIVIKKQEYLLDNSEIEIGYIWKGN